MFTLFIAGTLLDNVTSLIWEFWEDNPWMLVAMLMFILTASFTILNMLIGVLCEVVTTVKIREQEKTMIRDTQDRLKNIFLLGDIDGSGTISHDEFEAMSEYKEVLDALGEIGIEPKDFCAIAAVLFEDETDPAKSKSLSFPDFVKQVVSLRPEKNASVMDVADLRYGLRADVH